MLGQEGCEEGWGCEDEGGHGGWLFWLVFAGDLVHYLLEHVRGIGLERTKTLRTSATPATTVSASV